MDNREILELTGVSTYQRIGRAYACLGKFEAAIEFLEKTIEIEYEDEAVFELATILYDQKEYQKANLYFKQLDTMNPDFAGYEYVYGLSLHEEHKTQEALRLVQQGLTKNEFAVNLLLLASQLSYELHDSTQAENYLLKAKKVAEDDEEVLVRLTNLYLEEERFEDVLALENDDIDNLLIYLLDNYIKNMQPSLIYREIFNNDTIVTLTTKYLSETIDKSNDINFYNIL